MLGSVRPASVLPISLPSSNCPHLFKSIVVTNLLIHSTFRMFKVHPLDTTCGVGSGNNRFWCCKIFTPPVSNKPGKADICLTLDMISHMEANGGFENELSQLTSPRWSVEYLIVIREREIMFVGLFFFFSFAFLRLGELDLYIKSMICISAYLFPLWL